MRRNTAAAVGVAGIAGLLLAGCASPGGGQSGDPQSTTLRMAIAKDPGTLDPVMNATHSGEEIASFGYESLLTFPQGSPAVGSLAESWEETTTEATFVLKEGILCSDGAELTASDVKGTFDYANEQGSPYIGVYFHPEVEIAADDESRTVTFTNPVPNSFLAESIGSLPIVCGAGLEDPSVLENEQIGTGPFTLTDHSPGQSYSFEARDDYAWGPEGVTAAADQRPASVEVQVVESDATRANMLQAGETDLAAVGGQERDRLEGHDFAETVEVPQRPGMFFFNQAEGRPTHDLKVRQAIAHALDRDEIGAVSSSGHGEPLVTLVSEFGAACTVMDSSAAIPAFDTEKAEELLDEAGWTMGSNGVREKDGAALSVSLLFPVDEGAATTAAIELVQSRLAEVGIEGTPEPSSSYTDVIFSGGDWDLVWAPISTNFPSDWAGILGGEFPPNGGNWTYNTNQEYFDLVGIASEEAGEESCQLWQDAQDSLFSDLEVFPVYAATETVYGTSVEFGFSQTVLSPTTFAIAK